MSFSLVSIVSKIFFKRKILFCESTSTYENIFLALGSTNIYLKISIPFPYADLITFYYPIRFEETNGEIEKI